MGLLQGEAAKPKPSAPGSAGGPPPARPAPHPHASRPAPERGARHDEPRPRGDAGRDRRREPHPADAARRGRAHAPREAAAAAPAAPSTPSTPWDPASFRVPPADGKTRFHDLDLPAPILRAIHELGFQYATPIQAGVLPPALAGRDVAGQAQTGTGKTAAFLITIFNHCLRRPIEGRRTGAPRALILAPTRELVMQIERDALDLGCHTGLRSMAVYGGSELEKQRRRLAETNPDVICATPGRLLDFHARHDLHLNRVEILVIDEADRMLDMGFIPDVRRIVYGTPPKDRRQTMFFSATLNPTILRLAASWTRDPVKIEIAPERLAAESVDQRLYVVTSREKFALLYNLLQREKLDRVLLFANRRDAVDRLARELRRVGVACEAISGALAQKQRTRTLDAFREGRLRVLVATDVMGRGLHVEGISHVVNYNVPIDPEDYVHRIGRTGRAGASGISITFACEEEAFYIPPIEELLGHSIPCVHPPEDMLRLPPNAHANPIAEPPQDERPPMHADRGRRRGGPGGGRRGPPRRR
jgi:ATP-dependent RNA helicase RhlB